MGFSREAVGGVLSLIVHTARISYQGTDRLDITRKSGAGIGLLFAPSWKILTPMIDARRRWKTTATPFVDRVIEENRLWHDYAEAYLDEMRGSYARHRADWESLLERSEVTLCCYCSDYLACHRTLLANAVLTKLGATYKGER